MKDARQQMLKHAYATPGEMRTIPLVSGVPVELYRSALAEIRDLRKAALEVVEPSSAREFVLLLMSYERDKCSNGAWALQLCRDLGLDRDELTRELQRRKLEGAGDGK